MNTPKNIVLILLALSVLFLSSCKKNSNSPATETFTLETTISPGEAGTVSPNGGAYDKGSQVELSATANEGWVFSEWNGDLSGSSNPATITINQNMSVNALFEQLTYPLTVDIEGEGDVSEQIVNAKTDYEDGTIVELTATPSEHWTFGGWEGDVSGADNPVTVTMDQPKNVTAVFEKMNYSLTINTEGEGEVSQEIVNGKTDYEYGAMVELTGLPADEHRFVEWSGDFESTENPVTVTIDGNKTINALFEFGFDEDFEDGVANNWEFTDDRFSVEDGKLKFATGNDGNWGAGFYAQKFSNFKVELRVARTKSKQNFSNSIALFIRADGVLEEEQLEDGYQVNISQDGYGSVYKIEDGEATLFSPWVRLHDLNNRIGEYNTIAVNAYNKIFSLYVNGKHLIDLEDPTFTEGYIGVGAFAGENGDNEVLWDYIKVTPPDVPKSLPKSVQRTLDHANSNGSPESHSFN